MLVPKVSSLERVQCIINKNNEEREHNSTSILICFNNNNDILPHVRESRTVWDSGIHNGFRHLLLELGFWISIISGISSFFSCTPDAKTQDFGFHNKNLLDSGIRIPFHGARNCFLSTLRTAKTHVITVWCGICLTNNYYYTRRQYFSIPSTMLTKFPQCVLPVSGLPVTLSRVIGFVRADVAPGSYS